MRCKQNILHGVHQNNFVKNTEAEPAVPVSGAEMKNIWQESCLEQTRIYLDWGRKCTLIQRSARVHVLCMCIQKGKIHWFASELVYVLMEQSMQVTT